jgi:hypothetical protein
MIIRYHSVLITVFCVRRLMRHSTQTLVTISSLATVVMLLAVTIPTQQTAAAQVCTNEMQACNKGSPREEPGEPNIPSCWGQVSSGFAQTGDMGEHTSNPIPSDEDPDSPRLGLGNTLEDGPQGHGEVVGPRFGQTCE